MTLFDRLKKCDLSPLGLEYRPHAQRYFCTPIGARILFSTGVDGIHYCTVKGQGDTIFVVEPMSTPGEYVHPVAANLSDFVRLLLACGHEAAISQAWFMERARFDAFLTENPVTDAQRAVLDDLAAQTGLTPMEEPHTCIRSLQDGFAESVLRFGREYPRDELPPPCNDDPFTPPEWKAESAAPEWKVTFGGSFYDSAGHGRRGTERPIGKIFDWNGNRWHIPSAYVCADGLVIDALIEIDPEKVAAFLSQFDENFSEDALTVEEEERIIRENPLNADANAEIVLNGTVSAQVHGSSLVWSPVMPGDMQPDRTAGWVLDRYGMDKTRAWRIRRFHFPWVEGKKRPLRTLSLNLTPDEVSYSPPRFIVQSPGDTVTFAHPVTGENYTLTVAEIVPETLPPQVKAPRFFTRMVYTLTPEPPRRLLSIVDCAPSDPVPAEGKDGLSTDEAAAIGIIGGADGPTAVMVTSVSRGERLPGLHTACSSPRNAPAPTQAVEWRAVFHVKPCEGICVKLI